MPIKYQALGGGGLTELTVKTSVPNTTVTITKEDFEKVLVSDDSCLAIFKLQNGTYLIKVQAQDGIITQKEIVIANQEEVDMRDAMQAKDLPIGAKIKFANGKTFAVQLKNANTVQFISDFIIDTCAREYSDFTKETLYKEILPKYYDELTNREKATVVIGEYPYDEEWFGSSTEIFFAPSYFSVPSVKEMRPIDKEKRIKKFKNGNAGKYWLRDVQRHEDGRMWIYFVDAAGSISDTFPYGDTYGVVLVFNVRNETVLKRDTDGYWVIAE